MSQSVNIGIVGLGRLGKRHAENLAQRVPGARLVAAASPVESEQAWARDNLGITALYSDLPALLAHPGLDAVWLVTPTSLHAEQVGQALAAGKHVFCEKPLALTVAACDEVIAQAASHPKQVAMVGFMRRYDPAYMEAKRLLDNGDLGQLFRIHCESHDPVDPNGFFVKFAPTSGGIFLDCSIHDIDLVRWMLNGAVPRKVTASGTRTMYPALAECADVDNAVATVEFDNGVLASFHVSRTSHRGYEATMALTGTQSTVNVGHNLSALPVTHDRGNGQSRQGLPDFFGRFNDAFLIEARAFVDAIREGRPSPLTLEDAREATRIGVAMREALQSGAVVSL